MDKQLDKFLEKNLEEIITLDEFKNKLKTKKQLRIKYGVDVTNPMLHLGHAVNLWKMRELQEMGHKVVFLIGDFTSLIGDPTGKSKTRPQRTKDQIESDAKEYQKQVSKILLTDKKVFEVRRNSQWFGKMKVEEFLSILSMVTHAKLIQRDMFQKRIKEGEEIYMHEMLYPLLQGYDSVVLESDLTIIGSDQLFNEMMGRFYQEKFGQEPQVIMTTTITPGLDGKEKMSKSLGNFVALTDSPKEKFGKIMSIPDDLIFQYLKVYTDLDSEKIKELESKVKKGDNPRDAKVVLAYEVVKKYHGEDDAEKEKNNFTDVFSKGGVPDKMPEYKLKSKETVIDVLLNSKLVASKSDARRAIEQGGVSIDGEKVTNINAVATPGILKKGKRHFIKIK